MGLLGDLALGHQLLLGLGGGFDEGRGGVGNGLGRLQDHLVELVVGEVDAQPGIKMTPKLEKGLAIDKRSFTEVTNFVYKFFSQKHVTKVKVSPTK